QLREQYHVRIAEALVRSGVGKPVEICEHFFAGRAAERVHPYVEAAIQELQAGQLYGHAAALAQQALDVEGLIEGAERVLLLQRSASWFARSGRKHKERDLTNEAHALALTLGDKDLLARTTRSQAMRLSDDGKYEEALEVALRAREMALEGGYDRVIASASTTAGNALIWLGRIDEALALFEQALEADVRRGDPLATIVDHGNIGRALIMLGRRDEGLKSEHKALDMARENNLLWAQASLATNIGVTATEMGRLAEARAYLDESLALSLRMGHRVSEAVALVNMGRLHVLLGEFDTAADWSERGIELAQENNSVRIESYGWLYRAQELDWRGERDRAHECAQTALRMRRELKFVAGMPEVLIEAARLSPDDAERAALLDEAAECAAETKQPGYLWQAIAHRARHGLAPRPDLAPGDETEASVLQRLQGHWELYLATGDAEHRDAARAHVETLRAHAPAEFAESMVRNVPLYRDVSAAAS
ncbi:MAG: tetratricopeptide repeat protein, partial [Planctomycetota bacterium]|nr:tetratricopeptide repeat protein [Planctomycetota bacterium]